MNTRELLEVECERGIVPWLAVEGYGIARSSRYMLQRVLPPDVQARRPIVMDNAAAHRGERVRELVEAYGCSSLSESSRASRGLDVNEAGTVRGRILRVVRPRTHGGAGAKALDWVNLWASALHLVSAGKAVEGPAIEQRVSPP